MNGIIEKDLLEILEKIDLEKLKDKTVLITGSNGLIGTYLAGLLFKANELKNLNAKVICVSRNSPNKILSEFKDNPNFKFLSADLVKDLNLDEEVDYVIHAACYATPKKFLEDKMNTIKLNTEVTEKLLNLCKKNNASFLFLSSSEIYGQPDEKNIPTLENYNGNCSTTAERATYMESKRLGETICSIFKEDLDVKIARVSSVYGPGISIEDSRVLGHFLRKSITKKHIDMLDQGEQVRAWCYVSDCALMIFNILLHGNDFVYNVGGTSLVSIKQLAETVCKFTDAKLTMPEVKEDFMKGAPTLVQMDINKIIKEFNLGDFINMDQGIKNTVEWNLDELK
jgi:UDP-glucuronate decarboxylase